MCPLKIISLFTLLPCFFLEKSERAVYPKIRRINPARKINFSRRILMNEALFLFELE